VLIHDLKRSVAMAPDDAEARYRLGEALFIEKDVDGAVKQLEKAIELAPDHGGARRLLARAYLAGGRVTLAERALEEAVRLAPDDPGARDELADVLASGGRLDDALLHLEEAVALQPDDLSRRLRAAELSERRRLYERARGHLEHAQRRSPGDPDIVRRLEAIALEIGGAVAPISPLARGREFLVGRARSALKDRGLAREIGDGALSSCAEMLARGDLPGAKRALVTAPGELASTFAYRFLRAEIALADADLERARDAYERALQATPPAPRGHVEGGAALVRSRLAEIHAFSGRHEQAASLLREVLEASPDDASLLEALGEALWELGRPDEALRCLDRAAARSGDPAIVARLAARRASTAVPKGDDVGVVNALAWNAYGGIVSRVEAVAVPGKGELVLTGNVAKAGQDAARVAHACLKARAAERGLEARMSTHDLHLHYVDTEYEKDGPSAGLALALAGLSAFTRAPLSPRLAVSGEITLQGGVRAVGGLREKLVAAYLAGIGTVLLPRKNLFEARGLPKEVVRRVSVIYVDTLSEAIDQAFMRRGEP
jgi:ATP-dependent Lon protease